MATIDGMRRKREEREIKSKLEEKAYKEAVKKNPLLELSLGELVDNMITTAACHPILFKYKNPKDPSEIELLNKYNSLMQELNRREKEYNEKPAQRYIPPPVYG